MLVSNSPPSFPASSKSPSIPPCSPDRPPIILVEGGVGGNVEDGTDGLETGLPPLAAVKH